MPFAAAGFFILVIAPFYGLVFGGDKKEEPKQIPNPYEIHLNDTRPSAMDEE